MVTWVDRWLNEDTTDKFLKRFRLKFNAGNPSIENLEKIVTNLRENPWITQKVSDLANMSSECYAIEAEATWQILLDENLIKAERAIMSKTDLKIDEILRIMSLDPDCKSIIGDKEKQGNLLRQIKAVTSSNNRILVNNKSHLNSNKFLILKFIH